MFRFLIIVGLISYVLFKVGGFFFRMGAHSQSRTQPPRQPQADFQQPKKEKKGGAIKGGEYVDYEEVK